VVTLRADITKDDIEAYALLDDLGNTAHSIPFLAVFCGDKPNEPRVLSDVFTKDDLLKILDECPKPNKLETALAR
jgi:thiol:disulfide interchange protein